MKGRVAGAKTITVTRNEILYSLNKPENFILAIMEFVDGDCADSNTYGSRSAESRSSVRQASTTTTKSCSCGEWANVNSRPEFFEPVRERASRRWDQLEQDPELAGPWHQLFKQVQSPRHILSELLQNADDALATEASVQIKDNCFIFTHNGEDFTEQHFASLCRFGYSNKRARIPSGSAVSGSSLPSAWVT